MGLHLTCEGIAISRQVRRSVLVYASDRTTEYGRLLRHSPAITFTAQALQGIAVTTAHRDSRRDDCRYAPLRQWQRGGGGVSDVDGRHGDRRKAP
jgi:hypothetical protein